MPAMIPILADDALNLFVSDAVLGVGVRTITAAVLASEIVIVLVSDVSLIFSLLQFARIRRGEL